MPDAGVPERAPWSSMGAYEAVLRPHDLEHRSRQSRRAVIVVDASLPIGDLPNLGPKSARVLRSVGIATVGDLARVGCVPAYVRAKHVWEGASLNLLWGMVAGLRGVHWTQLDPAEKAQLMAEVEAFRLRPDGD